MLQVYTSSQKASDIYSVHDQFKKDEQVFGGYKRVSHKICHFTEMKQVDTNLLISQKIKTTQSGNFTTSMDKAFESTVWTIGGFQNALKELCNEGVHFKIILFRRSVGWEMGQGQINLCLSMEVTE